MGNIAFRNKDYKMQKSISKKLLRKDKTYTAKIKLAQIYQTQNNIKKAKKYIQKF